MAEFVQQSIEEMLPELEQMERVGLFTRAETRQILKKRKSLEYKLRRRTKCKEDFLQYIQYEINVLALVKKRRARIGYTFKRIEIDVAIIQRIHRLFRLVVFRFQEDVKLWLSHIEFCKQRKEKASISKLFTRMLQVHNRKPELWIHGAKWELEDNLNPDNARSLLQRGLRFNPQSKQLWLEYYRMELIYTDKMRKRHEVLGGCYPEVEDGVRDAVTKGVVAEVVYKKALEAFPDDVEFLLGFLPITQLFDFTNEQEELIFKDLQEMHPFKPLTWDEMARRHLQKSSKTDGEESDPLTNEVRCHKVYEEAVQLISTEEMWSLYIRACLEQIENKGSRKIKETRIQKALLVFETAADKKLLKAELFEKWLQLLTDVGLVDKVLEVSELATTLYPTSLALWRWRLGVQTANLSDEDEVIRVFREALTVVPGKESWPLWQLILDYCQINGSGQLESVLELGLSSCREICEPVKDFYLQWSFLQHGIDKARELYQRLSQINPVSLQFFRHRIAMEKAQPKPKMKIIRHVFEDAIREHGRRDTDLWIEYIQMEMNHPKGKPDKAGKLHFRALKSLDGELNQRFITQYTLLQTGHMDCMT